MNTSVSVNNQGYLITECTCGKTSQVEAVPSGDGFFSGVICECGELLRISVENFHSRYEALEWTYERAIFIASLDERSPDPAPVIKVYGLKTIDKVGASELRSIVRKYRYDPVLKRKEVPGVDIRQVETEKGLFAEVLFQGRAVMETVLPIASSLITGRSFRFNENKVPGERFSFKPMELKLWFGGPSPE